MTPYPSPLWAPGAKGPNGDDLTTAFISLFYYMQFTVHDESMTPSRYLHAACCSFIFTHFWTQHKLPVCCRDEQYRIMWNELETLVKAHVETSERHQQVLECITACRSKPPEEEERKKRGRKREDKEDKMEKNGKDSEEKGWTPDTERFEGFVIYLSVLMVRVQILTFTSEQCVEMLCVHK